MVSASQEESEFDREMNELKRRQLQERQNLRKKYESRRSARLTVTSEDASLAQMDAVRAARRAIEAVRRATTNAEFVVQRRLVEQRRQVAINILKQ